MRGSWLPRLDGLSAKSTGTRRGVLREILREVMEAEAGGEALDDPAFLVLALECFRYQADANPAYGAWVRRRGIDPLRAEALSDILPVPTRAFKSLRLLAEGSPIEATFKTTGTTEGSERRGSHFVRDLDLYHTSLLTTAHSAVFCHATSGSDRTGIRVLALTPGPDLAPESSLVHMLRTWITGTGDGRGGFFGDASWAPRSDELRSAVLESHRDGSPVLLVGTAFSFVRWLEGLEAEHPRLPRGSIIVETGGFKGKSRVVPRRELYGALTAALDVPARRIVNEYGMTELLSQFYEPVLSGEAPADPDCRWHVGPSWVRTRILDPETLEPIRPGSPGILCHVDLANLDSAVAVLTDDVGLEPTDLPVALPPGRAFRLLGRALGAEPRGCSLAMEELLGDTGLALRR